VFIVSVSKRWAVGRLEESIKTIHAYHCLVLIGSIQLLKNFCESVNWHFRVFNTFVDNFHKLFWVSKFITNSVS
jgi:hypothetical protein